MSYRGEHDHLIRSVDYKGYKGVDFDSYTEDQLQKLWRATLQKGMHGLCFSMYEDGQQPGDIITKAQVQRRVKIIKPHTQWVRSFSCLDGNEHIPTIAKNEGLKTMVGAWLSEDMELNEKEVEALITLAKAGHVDIAAVGNEVLYRNDLNKEQLLKYIQTVKDAVPDVKVGYVDAYYEFTQHPELVAISDVVLCNCYPFWEGCPQELALGHMQQMYGQATAAAKGKHVIITETGWPSHGASLKGAISSAENAMKYFINCQAWAAKDNIELFYFSSFDESWKTGDEGDVGAYWGLWDKNEKLKF
ncbi:MAG: glycosyl hydrolase family 17 protein [Leeuwenhoekiella sp.]